MANSAGVRICIDTGFSHDPVALLWWRHLGAWAAFRAERAAERSYVWRDGQTSAMECVADLIKGSEPDQMRDPSDERGQGGDWPVVRVVFYRSGDSSLFVEMRGPEGVELHEVHGRRQSRPDDEAWEALFNEIEKRSEGSR